MISTNHFPNFLPSLNCIWKLESSEGDLRIKILDFKFSNQNQEDTEISCTDNYIIVGINI